MAMAHYLVERYLPGMRADELCAVLARLAAATTGTAVRYIGSTILVEDEACFCHFEAPSVAAVAEVNRRAGITVDRIVAALSVAPPPD
jgi:hypothetical protein